MGTEKTTPMSSHWGLWWVKRLIYSILLFVREIFYNTEKGKRSIKAIDEDIWYVVDIELENIEWITLKNKTKEQFNINVNGICITDNGVMYATDIKNKMIILRLSPLGSVSTVFSAAPSRPSGICQSTEKDC